MKKLMLLFIAAISLNIASAQQFNDHGRMNGRGEAGNVKSMSRHNNNMYSSDHRNTGNDHRYDDRQRQAEIDRVNQDYGQRIDRYKNDRSINSYERKRRIYAMEKERQQKVNSFGTGLGVGAIAGLLLGVLVSK